MPTESWKCGSELSPIVQNLDAPNCFDAPSHLTLGVIILEAQQ